MPATAFEFRNRFWLIGAFFWIGFSLYMVDHVNAGAAMGSWTAARMGWPAGTVIRTIFALGALLAVVAAVIRTWACSFLRTEVVHDAALHSERLVADGPYRYVRNPLYLGTMLLSVGMGLMASRVGFVVIVAGNLWFNLRLIRREEAELKASQGESYRRYLAAVPCLVPSSAARVPASGGRSQWKQAFFGESFFWGFAAATVAFAISLKLAYFWATLAIAFLFYILALAFLKKQQRNATGD